jgi:hypothetical protein
MSGGDGGVSQCIVTITQLAPAPSVDLEPGLTLRLQATVSGYNGGADGGADGGAPTWDWSVNLSGVGSLASLNDLIKYVDDSHSTIDLPLGAPGTYQVDASIVGGAPQCYRQPMKYVVNAAKTPGYLFRVTPPSGSQLPVRQLPVASTFVGQGAQTLEIGDAQASQVVSLSPVDARGFALPSYVRITSPSFAFELEGYTGRGALVAPLATAFPYDVLVVPDDTSLAPLIVSGSPDVVTAKMAIVPGAAVTGTMHDGDGNAVAGARMVLRNGERPSTIGESGADGSFALTTRDGALSADVFAPAGSGLPDAHVASSPGVLLIAGRGSLDLAMEWSKLSATSLTVRVNGPGGASTVAGARVRADLATDMPNVGTLHVHGPTAADLTATGSAHAEAVTDAHGVASLGLLPSGMYHLIVSPPDGTAGAAITLTDASLSGGASTIVVPLAAPLTVTGTLMPAAGAAGATITAIDRGMLAAATVPTATAGSDGRYALALAAGRTYELLVEPNPALGLARSVVDVVTPAAGSVPRVYPVPAALVWKGTVTTGGRVVGGALVQAYCSAPAAACLDPSLAVAQAVTAADGTITLALPAPPAGP